MGRNKPKILSDLERKALLSDVIKILTCGDKEIVDTFGGFIEAEAKVCELLKRRKSIKK